jgi:hypothetical protein
MEPEGSLPHSQVPTTCPNPEPARSKSYPQIPLNGRGMEGNSCGRFHCCLSQPACSDWRRILNLPEDSLRWASIFESENSRIRRSVNHPTGTVGKLCNWYSILKQLLPSLRDVVLPNGVNGIFVLLGCYTELISLLGLLDPWRLARQFVPKRR